MLKFCFFSNNLTEIFWCRRFINCKFSVFIQEDYTKSLITNISHQKRTVDKKEQNKRLQQYEPRTMGEKIPQISNSENQKCVNIVSSGIDKRKKIINVHSRASYSYNQRKTDDLKFEAKITETVSEIAIDKFPMSINCDFPTFCYNSIDNDDTIVPILSQLNQNQSIEESINLLKEWYKEVDLGNLHPLPKQSANLAPYVSSSQTLTLLVNLGVDLSKIESLPGVAEFLIKTDFHEHIEPMLWKLYDFGFKPSHIARLITAFPKILELSLEDLVSRLSYFIDRKISQSSLVDLMCKYPTILQLSSVDIDKKLGQIKDLLRLRNDMVRNIIIKQPKLILHPLSKIKDSYVVVTKMMGFSQSVAEGLLLSNPSILVSERERLTENFTMMHSQLDLPLDMIKLWPETLTSFPHILFQRSTFLVRRGLFQPDPKKPLYTPLNDLILLDDHEFCTKFGRITEDKYDIFLRTL